MHQYCVHALHCVSLLFYMLSSVHYLLFCCVHLLQLTYADISLFLILEYYIEHANCGPVVERFPGVSSLKKSLENLPRIKEWVEKRPKSDH